MSAKIPNDEPKEFTAGATVQWRKTLPDFPPSAWTLTYYVRPRATGPTGFDVEASNDNGSHLVTIAATVSNVTAGTYPWQAWAVNGSDKRMVDSGEFQILPSLAGSLNTVALDTRSQAEKDLEAVRAALAGNLNALRYRIGSISTGIRELERYSKMELIELEKSLVARVNRQRRNAARKRGGSALKTVKVSFTDD